MEHKLPQNSSNPITISVASEFFFFFMYRAIHDLWTLLQELITYVLTIKNVNVNLVRIPSGYRVTGIIFFSYTPFCEPRVASHNLQPAEQEQSAQLALFTTERQRGLRPAVAFSNHRFKQRFV